MAESDSSHTRAVPNLVDRTFQFALRIVRLYTFLAKRPGAAREIGRQVLRSGTSVGANVEEAQGGQSRADFISKYGIALKEARETCYWLRLLEESGLVTRSRLGPLLRESGEITKILAACILSAKANKK
jgi:four helix bundle protein